MLEVVDEQRKRSDHGRVAAAARWGSTRMPEHIPEHMREHMREHPSGICPSDASRGRAIKGKSQDLSQDQDQDLKKHPPKSPQGDYSPEFEAFWKAWPKHPRKIDKVKSFSKWKRAISLGADPGSIMVSLEEWKVSDQWTKDGGNFIPGPKAWLHQEAYLAEFDTGPGPDSPEVRAAVAQYRKLLAEKVPAGHARSRVLDSIKPEVRAAVVKVIDAEGAQ